VPEHETLVLGAVAYDPKVVTIWEGFKAYFERRDLPFDYVLYSNYERQVEALLDGQIHVAWNSPLAWVRADRVARARGQVVAAIAMRDTDRDLASVIVVRADAPFQTVADLRGRTVAVGAIDSPQATLIPLHELRRAGLTPEVDVTVQRHDLLGGKHGDHVGGERDAARALVAGEADAACMIEGNYAAFQADGTIPAGATRVLARTAAYDHCNLTVGPAAPPELVERFRTLLLAMHYDDPEVRPLFDLEGLTMWCDGRVEGYRPLEVAVDEAGFYDVQGTLTAAGYRP
jgi:phosphonate transport system substrate-binding protein